MFKDKMDQPSTTASKATTRTLGNGVPVQNERMRKRERHRREEEGERERYDPRVGCLLNTLLPGRADGGERESLGGDYTSFISSFVGLHSLGSQLEPEAFFMMMCQLQGTYMY